MKDEKTHDPELEVCFQMGRDAALNGSNTTNCNFGLFSTPAKTLAWEAGNSVGKILRNENP